MNKAMLGKWLLIGGVIAMVFVLADYANTKYKNKSAYTPSDYLEFGGLLAVIAGLGLRWKSL